MQPYVIRAGDYLAKVAHKYGFDAAFDANYTYYGNPADSGNLWRYNHDGTGGVKIGPPVTWSIAQDATNLYYSTADTISVTHGVRVAKAGGGVTTVVTDTGLPVNTANRWFFGIDATDFYYGELTSGQFGAQDVPPRRGDPAGGWTAFAPTTMIFDDTWLYYDSGNTLQRIPR